MTEQKLEGNIICLKTLSIVSETICEGLGGVAL